MVMVTEPPSERAWREGEAATIAAVSAMNRAVAALVETIAMLDETDGWHGWGIKSLEHWVQWKADVSRGRAEGLVRIARRRADLPACWARFADGRLTEDAMVRIARRVPPERDAEVAATAAGLTISQLTRVLGTLPPLPDDGEGPPASEHQRHFRLWRRSDGWMSGRFCLPPDEAALADAALTAARDAVFKDRTDLPDDADVGPEARTVGWADAFVRLAHAGTDALDGTLQRAGRPGDRHLVVLHRDLASDGTVGPAQVHGGAHLPEPLARLLSCDTQLTVAVHHGGRLLGFTPTERTPNRRLRRWIERRDGGCVHPLCTARRWLHLHHLRHWEDGGPTEGWNLVALCPEHHRALHRGELTIHGNPEAGPLTFTDRWGSRIEPPAFADTGPPGEAPTPPTFRPPYGERLTEWTWN